MTEILHATTSKSDIQVAYLGPPGTYTHQAALQAFQTKTGAEYLPRPTITETFEAVRTANVFAVVPQENSIFGSVTDTYDCLRDESVGRDTFVVGETVLSIQHGLVARRGVRMSDIDVVMSHEQALGQCRQFITNHLKHAKLVKVASTAAAAAQLLHDQSSRSAAICSRLHVQMHDDVLQVLHEGIQDQKSNFTRFYLLSSKLTDIPAPTSALIRIQSSTGSGIDVINCLNVLNLFTRKVDRRPALGTDGFCDVYFVEVSPNSADYMLESGMTRVRALGASVDLLGVW